MGCKQVIPRDWRRTTKQGATAVLLIVALAFGACGGGGSSAPDTSTGPVTTGLLPEAPALGTILETDVAGLRVLRAGAAWRYTGVVRDFVAPARAYTNVVNQTAIGAGVMESGSNSLGDGADSQQVRIESGAVKIALPLNDLGVTRTIDFVELRTPVRAGDQITQFDERVADAVADLDGDGKREALDIAIWTRVIGEETIDLLHRPGLRAVRVDTSIAVRLRPSAPTSPAQQTATSVQRKWYATGVGLVRTEVETPTGDSFESTDKVIEELESWDGLTEGLGALPAATALLPGGSAALGAPFGAIAFSDHAVMVVGGPRSNNGATDPVMASINLRGAVTATYPISIADTSQSFGPGDLLRVGDGLRLVTRVVGANPGVVMTSRGGDGQPIGGAPVRLIDALPRATAHFGQRDIAVASTSNRIWLMWMRAAQGAAPEAVFSVDLVLQGFAPDGTPLSAPRVLLAQVDSNDIYEFNVAANSTHVLASWAFTGADHPYAVFDAASGDELARRTTTALPPYLLSSVPVAREGQLALSWGGNAGGAVLLDGNFNAVSTTTAGWQGDLFPSTPLLAVAGPNFSAQDDTWLLWGTQSKLREPLFGNALTTLALLTMPAGPGPLATRPLTIQARLPLSGGQPLIVEGVLVFADRLLVYGHSNDYTLITVPVWRTK